MKCFSLVREQLQLVYPVAYIVGASVANVATIVDASIVL